MASIRFNQIADARGSINGTVYSRGIGGLYMKNRVKPLNPQSTAQTAVRNQLAVLASSWRGLTDAQREAWGAQADNYPATNRLGETYKPSGYQLYMTLNGNLNAVGESIITAPLTPVDFTVNSFVDLQMDISLGALSVATATYNVANAADEVTLVEATGSLSQGVSSPSSSLFKKIQVGAASLDSVDFEVNYVAIYGEPTAGSKVFVKLSRVNTTTGQRELLGTLSTTVATV